MYLDGIFVLVDIIKNKFRKRPMEHEYAEMPEELNQIAKYHRGIHTDDQFEN